MVRFSFRRAAKKISGWSRIFVEFSDLCSFWEKFKIGFQIKSQFSDFQCKIWFQECQKISRFFSFSVIDGLWCSEFLMNWRNFIFQLCEDPFRLCITSASKFHFTSFFFFFSIPNTTRICFWKLWDKPNDTWKTERFWIYCVMKFCQLNDLVLSKRH